MLSRFRLTLAPRMGTPKDAMAGVRYHLSLMMPDGLWVKAEAR